MRTSESLDDWMERTRLHSAAEDGDLGEVKRLVSSGHSVHAFDELSFTPLHYAVRGEHYKVAVFLLEAGANVNAHDHEKAGETALGVAARGEYPEIVELLLRHGASPDIPGWMGVTARERARSRTDEDGQRIFALFQPQGVAGAGSGRGLGA
jgi:ankyrin repeat protein